MLEPGSLFGVDWKDPWGLVYEGNDKLHILPAEKAAGREDRFAHIETGDLKWGVIPENGIEVTPFIMPVSKNSVREKVGQIKKAKADEILRLLAMRIVEKHYKEIHERKEPFKPHRTPINYAGRVYDSEEIKALVDSSLDFWLTADRYSSFFETEMARFLGVKHIQLTNSGSSANLLAMCALTSPKLGDNLCRPGDEVITTACAFPTTVNPIIQNNLIPVFVDVEPDSYNIDPEKIEEAISSKTKAIFIAHTLGNPFDLDKVKSLAEKHGLWLIEDNCDALGSQYRERYTGTFGHISTFSFYPAHQITTGEGGALATSDPLLNRIIVSFRDWGRDCWCKPGRDNTCGKRHGWQLGQLPAGYDHKYIYSHLGYNLKMTDMQAAIGLAQMGKLPAFIKARRENWKILREGLAEYSNYFRLPEPRPESNPSWFGFLLTVLEDAPFSRDDITAYLESRSIATRMLFAGNLVRHPAFEGVRYRISGNLKNTDRAMKNAFWIGVYPGLDKPRLDYILDSFKAFIKMRSGG
jgi:CDP-6-deoxy-D-xylo-4-hexulose-3-dehydrase